MNTRWLTFRTASLAAIVVLAWTSAAWAGGRHHYPHHGHRGHSSVSVGVGFGYPAPYWRGYRRGYHSGWGYAPGYAFGPAYGPAPYGSIGIGYGSGGYHNSWGIGLSLPLYLGPRYPEPVRTVVVPATRQVSPRSAAGCRQIREYQTEIEIDGQWVPAYGQACLQADGSWKVLTDPVAADY